MLRPEVDPIHHHLPEVRHLEADRIHLRPEVLHLEADHIRHHPEDIRHPAGIPRRHQNRLGSCAPSLLPRETRGYSAEGDAVKISRLLGRTGLIRAYLLPKSVGSRFRVTTQQRRLES